MSFQIALPRRPKIPAVPGRTMLLSVSSPSIMSNARTNDSISAARTGSRWSAFAPVELGVLSDHIQPAHLAGIGIAALGEVAA